VTQITNKWLSQLIIERLSKKIIVPYPRTHPSKNLAVNAKEDSNHEPLIERNNHMRRNKESKLYETLIVSNKY